MPLDISKTVWYGETADSPPFADEGAPFRAELRFKAIPAVRDGRPTAALCCAYALGWPYVELYGGQLPAPIFVVAIRCDTGAVYVHPAQGSDASEQNAVVLYLSEQQAASERPAHNWVSTEAHFNVDLRALLSLPSEAADYYVCLWIDDLVTPMSVVRMPEAPADPDAPPSAKPPPPDDAFVAIRESQKLSPAEESGVVRTDRPTDGGGRIYGRVPAAALTTAPRAPGADRDPLLTVLALRQRSRIVGWRYADAFARLQGHKGAFDFDPFKVVPPPERPEHVFVLTILGTLRSEVLWIPGFGGAADAWQQSLTSALDDDD